MPNASDFEHALLVFACTFEPYITSPVKSIKELSDGLVFAHMVTGIDNLNITSS